MTATGLPNSSGSDGRARSFAPNSSAVPSRFSPSRKVFSSFSINELFFARSKRRFEQCSTWWRGRDSYGPPPNTSLCFQRFIERPSGAVPLGARRSFDPAKLPDRPRVGANRYRQLRQPSRVAAPPVKPEINIPIAHSFDRYAVLKLRPD